jgi:Ser/Thr protein kinase RdoA (MazF antagonist)
VHHAINEVLSAYDLSLSGFEHLSGGEDNLNIKVATQRGVFVLRRYERTSPQEVAFELDLMAHLAGVGFPTPHVITRKDASLVGVWDGHPVALFEFLAGHHPAVESDVAATEVARALADLHSLTRGIQGPTRSRTDHNRLLGFLRGMSESAERDAELEEFTRSVSELLRTRDILVARHGAQLWKSVIHHDPHEGNVLVDCKQHLVGLLDFDEAYIDASISDVARLLRTWASDQYTGVSSERARLLLDAYNDRRALSLEERGMLYDALLFACAADAAEYTIGGILAGHAVERLRECRSHKQYLRLIHNGEEFRTLVEEL